MADDNNIIDTLPVDIIMNTVLDGLITIDEHGKIQSFNPSAERIFQYTPEEVVGKNVKVLMPEPYHSEHDQYLVNYLTTKSKKVIGIGREVSAKRKDGTIFPIELGVNEMDVNGKRMFLGTIRDITDRKRAERELIDETNHLQAVLNTVLDGLITIDRHGIVQGFNPAAERIFGYKPHEVIGKNVKMLMPNPYHSEHDHYLEHYLKTGERKVIGIGRKVMAKRKDGMELPIELGVNEMNVAGQQMFVGTIRDITEQIEAENSITSYLEKLQHSNRELDEFAYVASHDLKSPLRGIDQLAQWISEDIEANNMDDVFNNLDLMRSRVKRLETLLNDLLAYSRVGRDSTDSVDIDCSTLFTEIFDLCAPKEFSLIIDNNLPAFSTHLVPFEQIIQNFFSNAVKHHHDKVGKVFVDHRDLGEFYEFLIKDDGPGIDPKNHQQIFSMFKTLKPRDEVEGSGMGLAMIKKIVEHYNGEVRIESELGYGATFYFTWPKII